MKKTKIVVTLGPATNNEEKIRALIQAGADVFRINFSHAEHNNVKKVIQTIRDVSSELGVYTSILADLQGPKIRVGNVVENTVVKEGDEITFITSEESFEGDGEKVYMNYRNFAKDVNKGEKILLDDGKLVFEVIDTDKKEKVLTKVVQGGPFKSKKGVNLPNTKISLPCLTPKDIKDAVFAIAQKVDWIALSFVRHSKDIQDLKDLIAKHSDYAIPIVAKIEKPEVLDKMDEVMKACQGIMVARGDLGVEIPAYEVPLVQKELVLKAKQNRIPVIIATQMMETMIDSLTPTRAEVNDVANSVMDGADAVMLSGETSVGKYPVEVVQTISSIIDNVENSDLIWLPQKPPHVKNDRYITKSICYHAANIANEIAAKAICTMTNSGYTAFQISAWRPNAHVLVFTSNKRILTQLNLLWGVKAIYYDKFENTDQTIVDVNLIAKEKNFVAVNDMVINLSAMPIVKKGMVNTLRISTID